VPLSVPELHRLLIRLDETTPGRRAFVLGWSYWRRRHQAIARACHIKRRRAALGDKRSL